MRTLAAALTAAFDSLHFSAYIRVHVGAATGAPLAYSVQPIKYKLGALEASVTIQTPTTDLTKLVRFTIERGALINGTPTTITSAFFWVSDIIFDGRLITLNGHIHKKLKALINADATYEQSINDINSDSNILNALFEDDTDPWLDYVFLPSSRVLNDSRYLFSLLKQKYLIFAREEGSELVTPGDLDFSYMTFFVASETIAVQYNIVDQLFKFNAGEEDRYFLWRDEAATIHTQGTATNPVHNLGYLASTASPPPIVSSPRPGSKATVPIHLKYQTGDYVTINSGSSAIHTFTGRIEVTEILDTRHEPAWYCEIEPLAFFTNTEGGALPSTIERVAAYTPLVTSNFDGILDASVNNLQALAERVDDHNHDADYSPTGHNHDTDYVAIIAGAYQEQPLTSTVDVWRVDNVSDTNFTGTIATLPGGSTLTYTITGGTNEDGIVPAGATQLGKVVLHNTTRGDSALIDSGTLATNTLVVDAIPVGWQVGDVITTRSQTNTQTGGALGGAYYYDIDLTHADNTVIPAGAVALKLDIEFYETGAGYAFFHPFSAFASGSNKRVFPNASRTLTVPITSSRFTVAINASGAGSAILVARISSVLI